MKYIVIEIQTTNTVAILTYDYEDRLQAESKYHLVLSAAAVSNVPVHTAVLMTNSGQVIATQCYKHAVEEVGE